MLFNFKRDLERLDGVETDNIKVLYYDLPAHFSGTYKTYEYSRLCTITQGEKHVSIVNNETFKYDSSKYLLLPPDSNVLMTINEPTKAVVYEINSDLIRQVREKVSNEYFFEYKTLSNSQYYVGNNNINLTLNRITEEFLKNCNASNFLIDLFTQELVYHIIQNKGASQILNSENNNPVNKAIRYMNNNYMEPSNIKELAYDLHMSETNFCQYFKKITKNTPNQYFTKIRLKKAKEMLKDYSVTETSYNLGYSNISYFIMLFKGMYGLTPKQYKMSGFCTSGTVGLDQSLNI